MLPSIRLIVATFLCSFLAVFAGLHLIALPRIATEPLPVASNAPGPDKGFGRTEGRRVEAIVPAAFELRFAPGASLFGAVPPSLTDHANSVRAARLQPPAAAPEDATPMLPPMIEQAAPAAEPAIEAPAAPLVITTDVPLDPASKPAAEAPKAPTAPAPVTAADQPVPSIAPRAAAAPEAAPAPASEPRTDVAAAPSVMHEPADTTAAPVTPAPSDNGTGTNGTIDDPAPASQAINPDITAAIATKPAPTVQKPRARKTVRVHRPRARFAARPAARPAARRGGIDYYSTPFGSWN